MKYCVKASSVEKLKLHYRASGVMPQNALYQIGAKAIKVWDCTQHGCPVYSICDHNGYQYGSCEPDNWIEAVDQLYFEIEQSADPAFAAGATSTL